MKRNLFSGDVAITAGTGFNGIVGEKGFTSVHIIRIKLVILFLFDFLCWEDLMGRDKLERESDERYTRRCLIIVVQATSRFPPSKGFFYK
jgi:hypothetical protein